MRWLGDERSAGTECHSRDVDWQAGRLDEMWTGSIVDIQERTHDSV